MDTRVGWEHARDSRGRVFYVNPLTREISWSLPTDDPPPGWQETTDGNGRVVDHTARITTWLNPRGTARRHPGRPDPKPASYEGWGRVVGTLPPYEHDFCSDYSPPSRPSCPRYSIESNDDRQTLTVNDHPGLRWAQENRYRHLVSWLQVKEAPRAYLRERNTTPWMVVDWLREHPYQACPSWILTYVANESQWRVLAWLFQNRPSTKCPVDVLQEAIACREAHVVQRLYKRDELKSWPRLSHASTLVELVTIRDDSCVRILTYIAMTRRKRYARDATDNPSYTEDSPRLVWRRKTRRFVLRAVSKVCRSRSLPRETGEIISQFVIESPLVHNSKVAVDHGWIHWLARFSDQPSKDMELLAERGDFIGAFWLHNRLMHVGCLECSKQFMYTTVESADLAQVTWHMLNCKIHSLQDWLYAAVWIGRVDVVDWFRRDKSSVINLRIQSARRGPRKRKSLFHSVDASLVSIQERFESELMEMEAEMNVNEEAAQKGDAFSALSSIAVDLAAIHGNLHLLECEPLHAASTTSTGWETLDSMSQDDYEVRVGCTVIGLYGAIINGHFEIVRWIYDNQPVLSNWPKLEDGAQLLRKLLDKPTRKDMLECFGRERGMRLDPHDLEEAVRRQDVERVRLIRELDLVESTGSAVDIAAAQGDLQLLQILAQEGEPLECTTQAMDGAAEGGHLRVVQFLHTLGARCTRRAIDLASKNGHIEVVQFLFQHRHEGCSPYAVYWASACGHESVVEYLTALQVPCNTQQCLAVARARGYRRIVEILERASCGSRQRPSRSSERQYARLPESGEASVT